MVLLCRLSETWRPIWMDHRLRAAHHEQPNSSSMRKDTTSVTTIK